VSKREPTEPADARSGSTPGFGTPTTPPPRVSTGGIEPADTTAPDTRPTSRGGSRHTERHAQGEAGTGDAATGPEPLRRTCRSTPRRSAKATGTTGSRCRLGAAYLRGSLRVMRTRCCLTPRTCTQPRKRASAAASAAATGLPLFCVTLVDRPGPPATAVAGVGWLRGRTNRVLTVRPGRRRASGRHPPTHPPPTKHTL